MTRDAKESVLSRWSRRKLEADQLGSAIDQSMQPDAQASPNVPVAEEGDAGQKPVLTDADMPDIETLNEDSDFSGFMSAGVSDNLRNLALRKLFKAPVFNIRDGLDEYDEDYTYFEKLGDIVTSDMKHQIEMQEKKLRESLEAEVEVADEDEIEADDTEAMATGDEEVETQSDEQPETLAQAERQAKPGQESGNE